LQCLHCHRLSRTILDSPQYRPPCRNTLILLFTLSFTVYSVFAPQISESLPSSSETFNSIPATDFTITASPPNVVPPDGTTTAASTIIVNPIGDFTGTVTLSDTPLPADITCKAITPVSISNGRGTAKLACTSTISGTYAVTIMGVSGGIRHNTTRTFTFSTSPSPDFTISSVSTVSFNSGSEATSNVTVTAQGEFDSQVNITTTIYPSIGLSVSLSPQHVAFGSGLSTATFSSSTPGDYTVQIIGTSNSVSHTITVTVTVTPVSIPDFRISASSSSINIDTVTSGTTRITITPDNGFVGNVSFTVVAPAGIVCNLSSTSLLSSGETTLTCQGNIAGDYAVTVAATGGPSPRTTTINVHVTAASPTAPVPTNGPTISLTASYGIIGTIAAFAIAVALLVIRRSRHSASELSDARA
jgi:hypothetical protein